MMTLDEFFQLNKGERWAYLEANMWGDGIDTHGVADRGPFEIPKWICNYCYGPQEFQPLTSFEETVLHRLTKEHDTNRTLKRLEG